MFQTIRCAAAIAALLAISAAVPVRAERVVFARNLALSPDGKTLAFAWAGDVWTVSAEGGIARRLTVNPADDRNPVWSPDGKTLAFASDRHGADNVFTMSADGGDVTRLTFGDRAETPSGWSPDGKLIYYHSMKAGETAREPRIYTVPATGGQSWRVLECSGAWARVSPDNERLVFTRGSSPFARTGYRGSANHDVWTYEFATGKFKNLTRFAGTDMYPLWGQVPGLGLGVYFLSDREGRVQSDSAADPRGTHNVWFQPLDGDARQLTFASGDRVRDFTVANDGLSISYTQWDQIFRVEDKGRDSDIPIPRPITIEAGADSVRKAAELRTFTRDADEAEASPDGKEIALVVRGEIFVIRTEPERPTRRVTDSMARDRDVTWSPDGKALYFVSDREGQEDVYRAISAEAPAKPLSESLRFKIERVTDNPLIERNPSISPDGKTLAFARDRGDLMLRDLASGDERTLVKSWNAPTYRWSPDSKWIAYEIEDAEFNADIWIEPADGSAPAVNISQHPDNDLNPQWSADGQILAFSSRRAGQDADMYFTFLSPELDEKSNFELITYFEKATERVKKRKPLSECAASGTIVLGTPTSQPGSQPTTSSAPASKPTSAPASRPAWLEATRRAVREFLKDEPEKKDADKKSKNGEKDKDKDKDKDDEKEVKYPYDLPTAYRRLRLVTSLPGDQASFALSPDGASYAFASSHEGSAALFCVKWNGEDRKKAISSAVGSLHWGLDGQRLFYLKSGVPGSCKDGGGDAKDHGFSARVNIDYVAEADQKFEDGARTFGLRFYHPTLKGLDWPALTRKYKALATRVRTTDEFNQIFDLFQGELNASHLGIGGPPGRDGGNEPLGYLGVEFDPAFAGPGLKVSNVLKNSPADRSESRLYAGDILLKVNGRVIGRDASIDDPLRNTVGEPVILEYLASPTRPASQPASQTASAPAASNPTPHSELRTPHSSPSSQPAIQNSPTELVIRPINFGAFNQLKYQEWVDANAAYVAEKSGGRVAYAHISGMGEPQFHVFERDLYAVAHGRDGLIVDVRNNGGGWTADWVLAVLNVRRHAYTVARGGEPGYPQDRLIFYSWTKPATMMCNQYSYSNAEIISHAFKNLKRGPLVGMTTFGAVISTGAFSLIDGTTIRMPNRGWYTIPGNKDMEDEGAIPDVLVPQTPEDEQLGRQLQLDAAIAATLEQLK
jgi:tricorn protease